MQEKFMFFKNFSEAIRKALPPERQAEAYKAICEFAIYDEIPSDQTLHLICLMIAPSLFKEDGRKNNGGNHNPNGKNQHKKEVNSGQSLVNSGQSLVNSGQSWSIPFRTETETETETEAETEAETEKEKEAEAFPPYDSPRRGKRFVRPTIDEVRAYCQERRNNVDAESFVNFYESKGWVVGKSPMKDWKAAVRTWEKKQHDNAPAPAEKRFDWEDDPNIVYDPETNTGSVEGVWYYHTWDFAKARMAYFKRKEEEGKNNG